MRNWIRTKASELGRVRHHFSFPVGVSLRVRLSPVSPKCAIAAPDVSLSVLLSSVYLCVLIFFSFPKCLFVCATVSLPACGRTFFLRLLISPSVSLCVCTCVSLTSLSPYVFVHLCCVCASHYFPFFCLFVRISVCFPPCENEPTCLPPLDYATVLCVFARLCVYRYICLSSVV